jgi:hypothetical protein
MKDEDNLFYSGDPFDHPGWKGTVKRARKGKKTQSAKHIGCPLKWLERVLPRIKSKSQLIVMLVIYRLTVLQRSKTVSLANGELGKLGVDRDAKSRALKGLRQTGLVKTRQDGRGAVIVTLLK